jgi:exopolysaccharide biosynthesis galactosyltransferase PssJ
MNGDARPRVAFLIPFASRRTKSRWDIACAHLRQTLKSIQNSSSESYCVVVAGHEPPNFNVETNAKVCFLPVDHDIPQHQDAVVSGRLDKLVKIGAAWNYAKSRWNPHYLMKLDADDLISARLVHWLENFGREPGYLIEHGWVWRSGARYFLQFTEYLDRVCASCLIVRGDIADREGPFLTGVEGIQLDEASLDFVTSDHYSLVPGSGTSTVLLNDSHQRYAAQFAYLGQKLSTLPFRAVIYRIGNPDSNSATLDTGRPTLRMIFGAIRRTHLMTRTLKGEFALE